MNVKTNAKCRETSSIDDYALDLPEDVLEGYELSDAVELACLEHVTGRDIRTTVHHQDGSKSVYLSAMPIYLEPDIKNYFPDSKAVNDALRGLIALIPAKASMTHKS